MKKTLIYKEQNELYWINEVGEKIRGRNPNMEGICSRLSGDCSGLYGNCSGIEGNINDCEITNEERKNGINIRNLIREEN